MDMDQFQVSPSLSSDVNTIDDTEDPEDLGLPVAAILTLSMAGYVLVLIGILVLRQCLLARGVCGEICEGSISCDCCFCCRKMAEVCNCHCLSVDRCLDVICPAKQQLSCSDIFCERPFCECCEDRPMCEDDCCDCSSCENINCMCCEISFRNTSPV